MFKYQFNWMYWRYFLWNYAGRQNDIQGMSPNGYEGNWITGMPAIDDMRLGIKTSDLPDYIKENKAYNRYFMLPLILGLFGLFFQWRKDKRNFTVVFLLFIMTGLAVAFYLNMPPLQPRERDYVFAGSTYAYAIWIGLGVIAVYEFINKRAKKAAKLTPVVASIMCMTVPLIMAVQNWDDHDRSGRYTARDFAHNYLASCGDNAILITFGDNDTFPLWYLQETEEERTDIRVMNTSLLGGDWYIDQMKCKAYNSDPVPFSLTKNHYRTGTNEIVYVVERTKLPLTAKQIISCIKDPEYRYEGETYIPTRTIIVPVDKEAALKNGIVSEKDKERIVDTVFLKINKNIILKSEMMIIDLLANYKWDRPIYFTTQHGDIELGQRNYYRYEGAAYKFVPIYTENKTTSASIYSDFDALRTSSEYGCVDYEVLYNNLMNQYRWGNMNQPNVLIDYFNVYQISFSQNIREQFGRLAKEAIKENKIPEAIAALDRCMELSPQEKFFYNICMPQHDLAMIDIINCYYRVNEAEKANNLFDAFVNETKKCIIFFVNAKHDDEYKIRWNIQYLQYLTKIALKYGENERAENINNFVSEMLK
jgi:hypothetical protein